MMNYEYLDCGQHDLVVVFELSSLQWIEQSQYTTL